MTVPPTDHSSVPNPPENYERFFVPAIGEPLAVDIVEEAALRSGERLLDVGCGTGIVARLAAKRVAPEGSVVGVDVNPGMLAVARSRAPDEAIDWHEASAESMPLPDESFDVVVCQMSLQFMPDRAGALREMRRVLAPGGRILIGLPGPASPAFETMAESMERHVGPPAAQFVRQVFSLHDPAEVRGLLEGVGFHDIEVRTGSKELTLPPPQDFYRQYVSATPLIVMMQEAEENTLDALEREVVESWRDLPGAGDDGMKGHQPMVLAQARR